MNNTLKKIKKLIERRESRIIFVIHKSQLLYELIWKIQNLIRRWKREEREKKFIEISNDDIICIRKKFLMRRFQWYKERLSTIIRVDILKTSESDIFITHYLWHSLVLIESYPRDLSSAINGIVIRISMYF